MKMLSEEDRDLVTARMVLEGWEPMRTTDGPGLMHAWRRLRGEQPGFTLGGDYEYVTVEHRPYPEIVTSLFDFFRDWVPGLPSDMDTNDITILARWLNYFEDGYDGDD